jgi:biotin-(acetyl-CoA carboxylase) ligase
VKTTQYFEHVRKRPDRATIRDEWISHVMHHPKRTEVQSDGRIRKWARIAEVDKVLRIILLEDGETVHNAFFDRSFKESGQ